MGIKYILPSFSLYRGGYRPCESCDFKRSNFLIYKKSGKYDKKIGKNRENYQQKSEKIGTFT